MNERKNIHTKREGRERQWGYREGKERKADKQTDRYKLISIYDNFVIIYT